MRHLLLRRENVPQGVTYGNSDAFAVRISSELRTCSVRTVDLKAIPTFAPRFENSRR